MLQPRPHSVTLTGLLLPRDDALSSLQSIMLIQCSRCGSEIERSAVVCVHCGGEAVMQSAAAFVAAPAATHAPELEYYPPASEAPALFTSSTLDSDHHLEGLSGWLILVGIGLVLSPVI